jgi:hypothetical protein
MEKSCEEECKWFLVDGFASVPTIIHRGGPLAQTLGDVNSAINACGYNEGIRAGFIYSADGQHTVETTPGFDPNASENLA